jgi:hypothetical protein
VKESLKYYLERTTPLGTLARFQRNRKLAKKFRQWEKDGAVPPMPHLGKQRVVLDYIRRYRMNLFVETGTYKGRMVYAVMPYVKEMYTIELDEAHFREAQKRFAGYPNIHILQGQSGHVLPDVLSGIQEPCLFWLDAHWSGGTTAKSELETPIMQELESIFGYKKANNSVILIDDAHLFTGKNDYPSLETLKACVLGRYPDWCFEVYNGIIRIHAQRNHARKP